MRRFRLSLTIAAALALTALLAPNIHASVPTRTANATDATFTGATVDKSSALVQLKGDPLSTSTRTRPARGKKIDFKSAAVKSERARLSAYRNDFKAWLRQNAPKARVTSEYDISLNAVAVRLNGTALSTIASSLYVVRAQYQGLYRPLGHEDPDLSIISAAEAWSQGGAPGNAGEGVKVAIVDSGIDDTHPCFDDAGYPSQTQLGDQSFTNNKVIAAKVFYNKSRVQGLTPEAIDSHGTHVAGTVACNLHTPATVESVDIPYDISGVAPRALLGNYNVFPGEVGNARSEDIVNALEAAYADGFDVANMSLGGPSAGFNDLLAMAVDDLDGANMVVAIAAGNEGPGHFTISSPGKAARALTAGASTVPHFVGTPITVDGTAYGLAAGDFEVVSSDLTAPFAIVPGSTNGLSTACSALSADLTGKVALISRGTCTFSTKIRNAETAGAAAVIVANNVAGDPVGMAQDGTPDQPTVPAYMTSKANIAALIADDGGTATISSALEYILTSNVDIMAGFSSQGPTDVDFRVKPDVVAPGVNVLSSIPSAFCDDPPCFAFFQGTSMATPHLAGSAAVVRWLHPGWSAAEIRSAIVNTAERGVLTAFSDGTTPVTDPNIEGAGREDLAAAGEAVVALGPVSVSFGAVPSRAGKSASSRVLVTNLTGSSATFAFSIGPSSGTGVSYSVTPSLTLAGGGSSWITVVITAAKGASAGDHQAWLEVSSGGDNVAHAAVYTLIK